MASPDTHVMRAVILQVREHWLAERRMTGEDRRDECWDGVLHMSPFPSTAHQRLARELLETLEPLATARGWEVFYEIGVFDPSNGDNNNRGPDVTIVAPEYLSRRGVEGRAELVIEVLSPYGESRDELPFFATCEIPEVWLVDPGTRVAEVFVLTAGRYVTVEPDAAGVHHAPLLGLALSVVAGPKLRIASSARVVEI